MTETLYVLPYYLQRDVFEGLIRLEFQQLFELAQYFEWLSYADKVSVENKSCVHL